ncbi:MAG: FAD-binding protein [Clostridia bacterium]|nr:FAD-binding protein [Clostridia bacterium]
MIKTDIILPIKYNTDIILEQIAERLPTLSREEIREMHLVRRSLDLTPTDAPVYRATVALTLDPEREAGLLKMRKKVKEADEERFTAPAYSADFRPVVVGAGPAGLFAALTLAEAGARPIILERGLPVEERAAKIKLFERLGILSPECNVQFGEGGAGAYSDGKLKTGARDKYKMKVIDELIGAGADGDIAFSDTAHLGTDRLPVLVRALRERIVSLGGEFIYSARLTDIVLRDGQLSSVTYEQNREKITLDTRAVILAVGHSARDTLTMLYNKGLKMSPRGFGIGMRIEHPREYINKIVYGRHANMIDDAASYHLVTHLSSGRSVYSFCMCPGGTVVAAASEEGGIVTNGMSEYARAAENSNAALLVSVTPRDFASDSPLSGIELQQKIERAAYSLTSDYRAPSESLGELLGGGAEGEVVPSYPRGTERISAEKYLPSFVTDSLRAAISDFDAWLPGYAYGGAVLTGPETRTTSPVRIERDGRHEALGFSGVYPAGEGAGYAGGIVSSAVDGIKTAEMLILNTK